MCKSPLHPLLTSLPLVEHHLHIEGTLEPAMMLTLAAKNNIALPSASQDPAFASATTLLERYRHFTSLDDFLHYYFIGMRTLITSSDFEDLAYAYFTRAHRDGVVHAEVFFDPQEHVKRGVTYSTVLEGLTKACTRAKFDFNISTILIPCLLRHFSPQDCHAAYEEYIFPSLSRGEVTGLGLSSSEKDNPPSKYTTTFDHARGNGIKTTAHAGEEGPVSYMSEALTTLQVNRVDHGIKLLHDPKILQQFVESKTLITMCPISNVVLRCVPSIKDLPIKEYLDKGVKFSINSDDPAYFGGYILDNYCAVQEAFGLNAEDWGKICTNAILGSWCSQERKDEMLGILGAATGRFAEKP